MESHQTLLEADFVIFNTLSVQSPYGYARASELPSISIDFFKSLPYFIKTDNGLFISHAGPSKKIYSMDDFKKIFSDDYENYYLYDFLWNRYKVNYDTNDISKFLKIIGSNYMIIGHNPVNRYEIFGKQLIISSSYKTDKKSEEDSQESNSVDMDFPYEDEELGSLSSDDDYKVSKIIYKESYNIETIFCLSDSSD